MRSLPYVRAGLLAGSCLEKALQLLRRLLDDVGEVGELTRDERYVRVVSRVELGRILGRPLRTRSCVRPATRRGSLRRPKRSVAPATAARSLQSPTSR